jgi:hypothetical protein
MLGVALERRTNGASAVKQLRQLTLIISVAFALPAIALAADCVCGPNCPCPDCPCDH